MKNETIGSTLVSQAGQTDWAKIRAMRDADICHDEDAPRTKDSDWEDAVIKKNGVVIGRVRGANKLPLKEQVSVRYSAEVLVAFRATGKGWQTRLNAALTDWLKTHKPEEV